MQVHHQAWVLSRIRVEIYALPKWQDKVTVKTWIENLEGFRTIRNIEMYLDGKKIAGATTFWAVFNTQLRKAEALALPHDHFEIYPDHKATAESFSRINILQETEKVMDRTVLLSDLDIVNHANNVKYLEWCLDTLDAKTILKQEVKNIEMNFLRELNLNDTIEIRTSKKDNQNYFSVVKEGKVCFALVMDMK